MTQKKIVSLLGMLVLSTSSLAFAGQPQDISPDTSPQSDTASDSKAKGSDQMKQGVSDEAKSDTQVESQSKAKSDTKAENKAKTDTSSQKAKTDTSSQKAKTNPNSKTISSTIQLNDTLSWPLPNGCRYTSTVKGSVAPVKSAKKAKSTNASESKVNPNLRVSSSVQCPDAAALRVTDNIMKTGELTPTELEQALERRASVVSDASGKRCVYMPDFELNQKKLSVQGVGYLCPIQ